MACCIVRPQSSTPTIALALYARIAEPPGEPSAATILPSWPRTITGDIDERGRLPGATAFATGRPPSTATYEKSVSWLLRKKPPTARPEPNSDSTDVVIETTLPCGSTTTKWLVPDASRVASAPRCRLASGSPAGGAAGMARSPISAARDATYRGSSNASTGTFTKAGSAT
jgi:hypothetical protein